MSVVTDDLVERVDEVVRDNRRFTISALSMEFLKVSSLYSIVKEHLGYKKHKNSLVATFYEESIGKLIHKYNKCLNRQGDYVEK